MDSYGSGPGSSKGCFRVPTIGDPWNVPLIHDGVFLLTRERYQSIWKLEAKFAEKPNLRKSRYIKKTGIAEKRFVEIEASGLVIKWSYGAPINGFGKNGFHWGLEVKSKGILLRVPTFFGCYKTKSFLTLRCCFPCICYTSCEMSGRCHENMESERGGFLRHPGKSCYTPKVLAKPLNKMGGWERTIRLPFQMVHPRKSNIDTKKLPNFKRELPFSKRSSPGVMSNSTHRNLFFLAPLGGDRGPPHHFWVSMWVFSERLTRGMSWWNCFG